MNQEKLTQSQLEQYLSKAAWILKGPVDASDFKVYVFPLLFFKRLSDVYDVRFDGWQQSSAGEREVQSELRKVLWLKYKLRDQALFDKAYAYIKEYY